MRKLPIFFLLLAFGFCLETKAQEKFKLDSSTIDVVVGDEAEIVTATAIIEGQFENASVVSWSGMRNFVEVSDGVLSEDQKSIVFSIKGLKSVNGLELTATMNSTKIPLTVNVFPQISRDTLNLNPALLENNFSEGITLAQKGQKTFTLTLDSLDQIPVTALSVATDDQNKIARASIQNNSLTIEAVDVGTTVVRLKAYNREILPLRINVVEGVDFSKIPSVVTVSKGGPAVTLQEKLKTDLDKLALSPTIDPEIAEISTDGKISANSAGRTSFDISLKDNPNISKTIILEVKPKLSAISFPNFDTSKGLLVGTTSIVTAVVEADDNASVNDVNVSIESSDNTCVTVIPRGQNSFSIRAERQNCPSVTLTATAQLNGQSLTQAIKVGISTVRGFSPLQIRLDILDQRMAKDLFGTRTADEFFIAKARLFNKIPEGNPASTATFWRNPILVYSESLSVKVAVQLRCDPEFRDCPENEREWRTWQKNEFLSIFKDGFPDPTWDACKVSPQEGYFFPYRPMAFEMVSSTQDSRSDRSTRHKVMTTINGLSSAASFITSIAVPGAGSDLPLGLDKFQNLLIPSIERLFPSMRETHRQNVVRWAMLPLEEIAFGSDVTKVIFFPKGAIRGMVPGYLVRITGVSISDSCAEVALIQKVTNL